MTPSAAMNGLVPLLPPKWYIISVKCRVNDLAPMTSRRSITAYDKPMLATEAAPSEARVVDDDQASHPSQERRSLSPKNWED